MGKIKRTTLKRKFDKLFGEKIRSKGYCELEGLDKVSCSGQLQTMHIIGRSNHNLRWDSYNALCGCSGHHRYYTSHPFEFMLLVSAHFPKKMEYLKKVRNDIWDKDYSKVEEEINETK